MYFEAKTNSGGSSSSKQQMDAGKYVRYTPEQVEALERVYGECPKPSSLRRQQLIRECPILANIEPKQIKVWFQNRRCREKQRKEASRLQAVNRKLNAMNKLLMEENDRLQKHVSHLVYENGFMRQRLHTVNVATDTSCESVAVIGKNKQQNPTRHSHRDANNPAGLLAVAEETLAEFLGKATGTAVDWVQMIGMKPGPDSIGIVAVSRNSSGGVAARACGLVSLEPMKVAEILKDRSSWFHDCRCVDIVNVIPTGNGGTIEIIYMQTYAPTTLASARDFWTLRYTTTLEDGSLVVCERSLTSSTGGPSGPPSTCFVRAEMLPSGCLVRPCDGGGSIVHIVDHMDLDAWSVPEVLRPLYESSKILAQKMTLAALRHIRQISQESNGEVQYSGGRQPSDMRALSQKLCRGFNDAVNGFADEGWSVMNSDGMEDVTIAVNTSPNKFLGSQYNNTLSIFPTIGGVICAKASMLLQDVSPALLIRFLREHRSEWADYSVDAYAAASLQGHTYTIPFARHGGFPSSQVILPLGQIIENEEFLEVVRLEGHAFSPEDIALSPDMYLLQHCSGVDENAAGSCAQLVFAPIHESFGENASVLPSGFRVIPLESKSGGSGAMKTRDLVPVLEGGTGVNANGGESDSKNHRSVLTIAFQFAFENQYHEHVAAMARQYVRSIVGSVQRVAMAISPSRPGSHLVPKPPLPVSPEAVTLARWIWRSYKMHTEGELLQVDAHGNDAILKRIWHHNDAIMCCSVKENSSAVFGFANQAGLDMLETTLVALQDIMLDKVLDEAGRKVLLSEFPRIMQQGYVYLPAGVCMSSMGRAVSYDQAVAWKVLNDEDVNHCLAFMFINWSFI